VDEVGLQERLTGLGICLPSPVLDNLRVDKAGAGDDGVDLILGLPPPAGEGDNELDALVRAMADEVAINHKYSGRGGDVPPPPVDDLSNLAALLGGGAEEVPDETEGDDAADLANALKLAKNTITEVATNQLGLCQVGIMVVMVREVVQKLGGGE